MPTGKIYSPYANPVKFHPYNPTLIPQYLSMFMDDHFFVDTIRSFEAKTKFCQQWITKDAVRLQYTSDYGPMALLLYQVLGNRTPMLVNSYPFDTMQQDFFNPGFYIRQVDVDNNVLVPGNYYYIIEAAGEPVLISEPQKICTTAPNTILIQYRHYEKHLGLWFDAPFNPSIRVPAILKYKQTASKSVMYEDQPLNETLVSSIPYRVFEFTLGDARGVPPWFADKVARIQCCSETMYDGRLFTKADDSEFDANELDLYPMAGYKIDLRETLNRDSMIIENDIVITSRASVVLIQDTKGFGINDSSGDDFAEIIDVE
jgi:hypothetical protein